MSLAAATVGGLSLHDSHSDRKTTHWEVAHPGFLLLGLCILLLCLQSAPDCTRLLGPQVKGLVLFALVLFSRLSLLLLVIDGQDPSNVLPDNLDLCKLGRGTT